MNPLIAFIGVASSWDMDANIADSSSSASRLGVTWEGVSSSNSQLNMLSGVSRPRSSDSESPCRLRMGESLSRYAVSKLSHTLGRDAEGKAGENRGWLGRE